MKSSAFWKPSPKRPRRLAKKEEEENYGKTDCLRRKFPTGHSSRCEPVGGRRKSHPGPQGPERCAGEKIRRAEHHQRRCDGRQRDRVEGPAREHGSADGARSRFEDL